MRDAGNIDKERTANLVIEFDLENVIMLPKSEISCCFYKRKLKCINETGYVLPSKKGYCIIWPDILMGKSGNDIASAVYKLIESVIKENPDFVDIITWSDSCVPQNRNSFILYAIICLLIDYKHLRNVAMKYSVVGYSCIQNVENMHSNIEKALRVSKFFSPISFLRILLNCHRVKRYKVI